MTPAEQAYKETMEIIMHGFNHKLTPMEISRLAKLVGYYRGGKGRPPKDKQHLHRITDADFDTPEAYKSLVERIIGKPVRITPVWKRQRPKGSKSQQVKTRKLERYQLEVDSYEQGHYSTTEQIFEQATGESWPTGSSEAKYRRYDSNKRTFRRDIADGHKITAVENADKDALNDIAESLRNISDKHSK